MRKHIRYLGGLIIFSLSAQYTYAACVMNNKSTYQTRDVQMNMGQISLDPNKKVGEIYKTGEFFFNGQDNIATCSGKSGYATGVLVQNRALTTIPYTYATNVRGIGIRLYRDSGEIQTFYPHIITPGNGDNVRFVGGKFKVDIIKTEETVGTGSLTSGLYSTYHYDGTPEKAILTSTLNADGIQLVNPTCSITQETENQTIGMGNVRVSEFANIGDTKNERDFSIKLACNGGNTKIQKINLGFQYTPDNNHGSNGVIANAQGANHASGIGIQLLNAKTGSVLPVKNNDSVFLGSSILNTKNELILPMKARYYKTAVNMTSGSVYATTTFNIEYN